MKKEDLKNKTTENLKGDLKTLKVITGALIGVLLPLFAITIYGIFAKEDNTTFIALMAVAISCSAIIPIQFSSIKKIKNELELRNNSN